LSSSDRYDGAQRPAMSRSFGLREALCDFDFIDYVMLSLRFLKYSKYCNLS
jgi:hypothetical protein